ncbi:GMC family oxidoreductase N-terminal domain-containing protein [candidate division CSSED10-310 bacterium]|uniref:GMC family oxidoreductase N-terminal domain-containing protein n=1 Tax=candidate division CSSED10-310 bacterium TaxID=2855610 RepID=A0ABV6Z028_UNCC1
MSNISYEYIVIGTGPGGATVARELARAGKNVLMIEKGRQHETGLGFPLGMRILEGFGYLNRTVEGVLIARGITVGGSSMVYNANVYDPPAWLYATMGLDFQQETQEIKNEIGVRTLPDDFFHHCHGGNKVRAAAEKMGIPFQAQEKFIDPTLCKIGCDWCMLGCRRNAKWTTREYVREALQNKATLLHTTPVEKIITDRKQKAIGVQLKNGTIVHGDKIVLAAGGIGSAEILHNSEMPGVGTNFFLDPMNVIVGYAKEKSGGAWGEMTFSHAIQHYEESEGFIIGNISASYAAITASVRFNVFKKNWWKALPALKRGIGLFVKIADSPQGEVKKDGRISKVLTEEDRAKMGHGTDIAREILIKAGIPPASIVVAERMGGHPGGTAAMGRIVNQKFETEFQNLYICDASILPVSPGVPPTLIILALSKFFTKLLLAKG